MTTIQAAAAVGLFIGILTVVGMLYHGIKRIAFIELQVTNHIPHALQELKDKQIMISDGLTAHEAKAEVYWHMIEQLMVMKKNGENIRLI